MDYLLTLFSDPAAWAALAALVAMEVVLGIDNLIFISVLTNKLPEEKRAGARRLGIGAALVLRLALLSTLTIIVALKEPVFSLFDHAFSWRDIILILGGAFLIWKATSEIHHAVTPDSAGGSVFATQATVTVGGIIVQILLLDLVFSIDSILTAVGMTPHLPIMVIAVVFAVGVMLLAAEPLSNFLHDNPTVVMLALGFLLMIGGTLIAEGFGAHFPKGYIYTAMAFSALVEFLNMLARRRKRRNNPSAS